MSTPASYGYEAALEHKETECLPHITSNLANCKWFADLQRDFKVALSNYSKDLHKIVEQATAPHPACLPYGENFVKSNLETVQHAIDKFTASFDTSVIGTLDSAHKDGTKSNTNIKASLAKAQKDKAKAGAEKQKTEQAMAAITQKMAETQTASPSITKDKAKMVKKDDEIKEHLSEILDHFQGLRKQLETLDYTTFHSMIKATDAAQKDVRTMSQTIRDVGETMNKIRQKNSAKNNLDGFLSKIADARKNMLPQLVVITD